MASETKSASGYTRPWRSGAISFGINVLSSTPTIAVSFGCSQPSIGSTRVSQLGLRQPDSMILRFITSLALSTARTSSHEILWEGRENKGAPLGMGVLALRLDSTRGRAPQRRAPLAESRCRGSLSMHTMRVLESSRARLAWSLSHTPLPSSDNSLRNAYHVLLHFLFASSTRRLILMQARWLTLSRRPQGRREGRGGSAAVICINASRQALLV